jgi:hypothetical protein
VTDRLPLGPVTRSDACCTDPLVGRSLTVTTQEWPGLRRHELRETDQIASRGDSVIVTCIAVPDAQILSLR